MMKKIKFFKQQISCGGILILALMLSLGLTSCQPDDTGGLEATGPPSITSVALTARDSTTTVGLRQNSYTIYGENLATTQEVYFNDTEAYFNPTLVTNNVIITSIPEDAPYFDASDELRVVTSEGVATTFFMIEQPAPRITSFAPLAASAGDIVTIQGEIFEGLESVRFGDVEAEIVSSTTTEIQVAVPEGIVQAFLFVETAGGISQSTQSFGFKFVVYDDALAQSWWIGGWSGSEDFESTERVKRGDFSIKRTYEGGYSGFQIGNGGATIDLADKQAVKVSIYGGEGINDVKLVLNGNYDAGAVITINQGEWNDFTIPLSQLGSPATLNEIVIQEFSGAAPSVIYIDDLGLI
ncbi:hypothetical protein CJ305_01915 [Leeuwenhoekiella nanhaiensis]|uniref:IPT/TIG domain-containing protein n=1 Tax=Leeuwenhoekiella nanhaiensis TaxID=1655491 RepID=A0A2G1VW68_9FLAO|nr:hypothetical protein CJ305_01915 [Leeuwenhoekiella nanhaiensis]